MHLPLAADAAADIEDDPYCLLWLTLNRRPPAELNVPVAFVLSLHSFQTGLPIYPQLSNNFGDPGEPFRDACVNTSEHDTLLQQVS